MSKSRQPGKARCSGCNSFMRNKTTDGIKLTNNSKLCVNCDADAVIAELYAKVDARYKQ